MNPKTLWWYRRKKRESAVAPTITSAAPADPEYGVAYSHTYTATGSPAPTWSVTAGALPDGLSLHATTGVLSGTPTASGAFSWTVTATNVAGTDDQAATATVTYLSKALFYAPIALYSLIGSSNPANDLSGNGRHGTVNGATPAGGAAVPFPEGGNAMLFDGVNDWIDCFSAGLAAAIDKNSLTLIAWVRPSTWNGGSSRSAAVIKANVIDYIEIIKPGAANTMTANILPGGQLNKSGLTVVEYEFMAIRVNGTNGYAYYDSGTAYNSTARTLWTTDITTVNIGGRSTAYWSGSIAYVGIYPLLSEAAVASLATP